MYTRLHCFPRLLLAPEMFSGLLIYAKTQEAITPDCLFNLGGNLIGARTLDLNQDFRQIAAQLDGIAQQFFGKPPQRIGTGSKYPDG